MSVPLDANGLPYIRSDVEQCVMLRAWLMELFGMHRRLRGIFENTMQECLTQHSTDEGESGDSLSCSNATSSFLHLAPEPPCTTCTTSSDSWLNSLETHDGPYI